MRSRFGEKEFSMSMEEFAEMQRVFGGFGYNPNYNKEKYEDLKRQLRSGETVTIEEVCLVIFPKIFGTFDVKIDYDEAEKDTLTWLNAVLQAEPDKNAGYDHFSWLCDCSMLYVVLGTVYAYKQEFVKSAYYFMKGIKSRTINVSMPYCDFIRQVLSKLDEMDIPLDERKGVGYEVDEPMGSCEGGAFLQANIALDVISNMEGENGEVIVAEQGRIHMFGHLVRLGSTSSDKIPEMLDIYETYVIDSEFNIKKIRFIFNGYFKPSFMKKIRLAKGFKLKNDSRLEDLYSVVN